MEHDYAFFIVFVCGEEARELTRYSIGQAEIEGWR